MKTSSKLSYIFSMAIATASLSVFAASTQNGLVGGIFTGDDTLPGIQDDWAYLLDSPSSGCNTTTVDSENRTIIKIKDTERGKRQFTTLLSAQLTGRIVQVSLEENESGLCYLRWVRIR